MKENNIHNELISVIIPVYNTRVYLEECINSIKNQTYTNLEIILIDDGSTDGSGNMCDEFANDDDRIKVIHKKNEGQGGARNVALDIAAGEYIAFVDSDDIVKSNMLFEMLYNIKRNSCDLAISGISFKSEFGRVNNKNYCQSIEIWDTKKLIGEYFEGNVFTGMCNKLYHKSLFRGIRFPKTRCREDVYILHEILARCRATVVLPQCYYVQNIRCGSTEQKKFDIYKYEVTKEVIERQKEFIDNNYPEYKNLLALKLPNELYFFLREIVIKNKLKFNSEIYKNFLWLLEDEIKRMDVTILGRQQKKVYNKLMIAVKKPKKYYIKNVLLRQIQNVKNIIKFVIKRRG